MVHNRPLRAGGKVMFESFNTARWSLGECFDGSVGTVAHVAYHLMSRGCSLRKEPVPDSLNFALYQKLSCYSHALETTYT